MVDHRHDVVERLDAGKRGASSRGPSARRTGRGLARRARRPGRGLARRRWSTIGPTSSSRSTRGSAGGVVAGAIGSTYRPWPREASVVDHRPTSSSRSTSRPWPREASAVVDHRADVVEPLDVQALARRRRSTIGPTSSSRSTRGSAGARRPGPRKASAVDHRPTSSSRSTSRPWPREASAVDHRADVVEPLDVQALARRRRSTIGPTSSSRSTRGPSAGGVVAAGGLDVGALASRGVGGGRPSGRRRRAARRGEARGASSRGPSARRPGARLARRRRSTIGPTSSSGLTSRAGRNLGDQRRGLDGARRAEPLGGRWVKTELTNHLQRNE